MEAVINQLNAMVGSGAGSLILLAIFASVFLVVVAVSGLLGQRNPVKRRLAGEAAPEERSAATLRTDRDSAWHGFIKSIESKVVPSNEEERSKLRDKLIQAGFMSPNAVTVFYAIRIPFGIALPLGFLLLSPSLLGPLPMQKTILYAAICGLVGLYVPNYWLSRRLESRQRRIAEGFPDALDMLVVCTEAGLGLDAAFQRVGSQIANAHPELAEQIAWVSLEMRAGKARQDALRDMSKRIGLAEIQSFVTLLIQSDALGASIAQTLRVNSDEMRVKRMMKAEEKAYSLPVKLSIPLVLFILPSMITVVLLPGIISIVRNMLPALTGVGG